MAGTIQRQMKEQAEQSFSGTFFYRLGLFMASNRWKVIGVWLVLLVAGGLMLPGFQKSLTTSGLAVNNSESLQVSKLLKNNFSQNYAEQDSLVFYSASLTVKDTRYSQVITDAVRQIGGLSRVGVVISPLAPEALNQVSADGHAAFAIVGVNGNDDQLLEVAPQLIKVAKAVSTSDVQVAVTGYSPVASDLIDIEGRDLEQSEIFGLPVALVVLLVAFSSLIAALLPIPLALLGVVVTFGTLGAVSYFAGHFNLFLENMAPMIGIGVGIDYTLFILTRFREELASGEDTHTAVAIASATAGKTVFFSGSTVLIALSGLLLVNSKVFTDIAIGAMVVVGVMVLVALTLLPAILALLGKRVNKFSLPFFKPAWTKTASENGFWSRWSRTVMLHPVLWLLGVTAVLLVLTAPVFNLNLGVDYGTSALGNSSAGVGLEILGKYFSKGELSPVHVLVESTSGPLNDQDLTEVAELTAKLKSDPAVAQVTSITTLLDQYAGNHSAAVLKTVSTIPQAGSYLDYFINLKQGSNLTLVTVIPGVAVDSPEAYHLIDRIHQQYAPTIEKNQRLRVMVGGLTAETVDLSNEVFSKMPWVFCLVLGLSFILLTLAFRSIFLPIKAIVLNLLSVSASYGLLVLFFQEGWGEKIFGFTSSGSIQVYLPMLTFAVLFGLSMDYEVFLIGRMKEEWRHSHDNDRAVANGLQHTARIITSAAAIMVAVFGSFAFTTELEIKEMGFSLAVAVLVDATLIRLLLVPAAMKIMGHWNWWFPAWLDRRLPQFDL